jgi:DNA-binding GntR family transcriptional regulator
LIGLLEKRDKESAARLLKTHLVNAVSDVLTGMKLVEAPATYGNPGSIPRIKP